MSAVAADIYSYLAERGTAKSIAGGDEDKSNDDDNDDEEPVAPPSPRSDCHSTVDDDNALEKPSTDSDENPEQTQVSDEEDDSKDDATEIDSPNDDASYAMTGLQVFKRKSNSESGGSDTAHMVLLNAAKRYEIERGITMCDPEVIQAFKALYRQYSNHPEGERHFDAVFRACGALQFEHAQSSLLEHLEERQVEKSVTTRMPATWNMSNEDEIIDAIGVLEDTEDHFKIHKIFAQMNLFSLVQSKQRAPTLGRGRGTRIAEYKVVLHEMSQAGAKGKSDEKKKRRQARAERAYAGGQRWHSVCEWFGGPGTVLVFVTAGKVIPSFSSRIHTDFQFLGVGRWYIEHGWQKSQMKCFGSISKSLHHIRKMVRVLGSDALEEYCRHGRLSEVVVQRVRALEGYE